jgi:hypothetical protein
VTLLRIAAWLTLAVATLELCCREVARRSLLAFASNPPDPGAVAFVAGIAALVGLLGSRRSMGRKLTAFVFAGLFALGVGAQINLGARLQSDGFYYFAYLRSLAFDGDVDFSNDYRLLGLGDKTHLFVPSPTGHAQSAWTIGPAFTWAPFFALAHPIAGRLAASGAQVNTDGSSYPYRQAVCIAGLFYGLLGAWFSWRLAELFFPKGLAAGAVAFTIAGSFLLWYIVKEPTMTHAPSMAGVAGFTWMWAATHGRRSRMQWAALGLLAGFITLIRWQNALFAILPACETLASLLTHARRKDGAGVGATLVAGALFTACATIGFLPQMLAWKAIYGTYLAVSPVGPQIRWWDPHLVDILWSSRNGLLSWSPILYIGAIGLFRFARTQPAIGVPAILAIAVMTYFNASIQDWWGSAGYGGRRFDGTLPLFALGVASIAERAAELTRRYPMRVVAVFGTLMTVWNLTLMSAAQYGRVGIGEPVSFGNVGAEQARAFHRWFGHPFTYPISLLFAARNDVPIGAYDLLAGNRLLSDPQYPAGRLNIGEAYDEVWIESGWHAPERSGTTSFRWATRTAALIVPLDHAANLRVDVRAQAFNYPGAPPQTVSLVVNGVAQPAVAVSPEWGMASFLVNREAWRSGVNRVALLFAQEARPADVGLGNDARSLSAAVDYVHLEEIRQP